MTSASMLSRPETGPLAVVMSKGARLSAGLCQAVIASMGSSVMVSAPPRTLRLYCRPVSAAHTARMSWRMVSGVSPVHTSVIRVGRLGMSPA